MVPLISQAEPKAPLFFSALQFVAEPRFDFFDVEKALKNEFGFVRVPVSS